MQLTNRTCNKKEKKKQINIDTYNEIRRCTILQREKERKEKGKEFDFCMQHTKHDYIDYNKFCTSSRKI